MGRRRIANAPSPRFGGAAAPQRLDQEVGHNVPPRAWAERRFSGRAVGYGSGMSTPPLEALLERGEEEGCVNLSELSELTQDLPEDEAHAIADRLEQRGIEVTDDCGRRSEPGPTYALDELSHM